MAKILVSACLLGVNCRYKGDGKPCRAVLDMAGKHTLIPVCPEQMGGLPTPRPPAEQKGGRVVTKDGADLTDAFVRGARDALIPALLNGADYAVLKARSPSCGKGKVYDGSFSGTLVDGDGVFAALLKKEGIPVYTEEELHEIPED